MTGGSYHIVSLKIRARFEDCLLILAIRQSMMKAISMSEASPLMQKEPVLNYGLSMLRRCGKERKRWSVASSCLSECHTGELSVIYSALQIVIDNLCSFSLHGTWVPNSQVDNQRTLETPLPFQPPLVQKIMSSRFRHFFNVFKARPLRREKSLIEKAAFGVMFPLAWVMLLAATAEVIKDYERRSGELQWLQWVKTGMSQGMTLERFPLVPVSFHRREQEGADLIFWPLCSLLLLAFAAC
jgi:hypothetical protein